MTERHFCSVCNRRVSDNQKALYCDICCTWVHLKCTLIDVEEYHRISNSNDDWYCTRCLEDIFPFNSTMDDMDFVNCLFSYSRVNLMSASAIKNSVQYNLSNKFKLNHNDIDPDKHFYNFDQIPGNNYYLENDFNDLNISSSSFSVLHINARSLQANINSIKFYLNMLNHSFSVIAISETWEREDSSMYFLSQVIT